ncbi:hypothetical protein ACM7Q1_05010 [Paenibacillus illinoisensis]|uniref:hypothetical protein n=1 Tax=Paenibacillus illinoisensis TaxID=59845 RepID=UPI003A4D71B5
MSKENTKKSINNITQVKQVSKQKQTDEAEEQTRALEEARAEHELLDKVREEQIKGKGSMRWKHVPIASKSVYLIVILPFNSLN